MSIKGYATNSGGKKHPIHERNGIVEKEFSDLTNDMIKVPKKEISPEGKALQRDLLEALKNTPRDKRKLRVITYKDGYQLTHNIVSLDGISSFEHARKDLAKLIKNQRVDQTIGWDNGHVKVLVEKYWEVPKGYFEQFPEKKEKFYIHGHTDKKQLVTVFHIQDRNIGKSIRNAYIYGKIIKDDYFD